MVRKEEVKIDPPERTEIGFLALHRHATGALSRADGDGSPARRKDGDLNKAKISRQMTVASAKKHSTPSRNQQEQQEQKDKEVIDAESRGATAANRLY